MDHLLKFNFDDYANIEKKELRILLAYHLIVTTMNPEGSSLGRIHTRKKFWTSFIKPKFEPYHMGL